MMTPVRTIGVVTGSRADYGHLLPVLRKIREAPDLALHLLVTGMHLAPEFGLTVRQVEADGFALGDRIEMLLSSDTPDGIARSMGLGTIGFAQSFSRLRPDLLVVLGDRFEIHAAALAALPFAIPVAHIHGGEVTSGVIDDALRHSITKLSHLHFAATEESARRVIQMGEEPWRVEVCGAPGLDQLRTIQPLDADALSTEYDLVLQPPPLLVTYHPVTLEPGQAERQVRELLGALEASGMPVVFTTPNADAGGRLITEALAEFVRAHPSARLLANLGTQAYWSLMRQAAAMVGNSSSGIIEAPSFGVPVINIGTRQQGRVRAGNVIDVGCCREEILDGIRTAVSPAFRARLKGMRNPYGDGHAAERIVKRLEAVALDEALIRKRFTDVPSSSALSDPAQERILGKPGRSVPQVAQR